MTVVRRFDTVEFSSPVRLDNGYLRADAHITKTGVFAYLLANGTKRRELRLPSEVFAKESMDSFIDVPLTNGHPSESLTSRNTRKFQIGNVNNIKQDSPFVAAKVLVTDEDGIEKAEKGDSQLSCGYRCDLEMTSGATLGIDGVPDGQRFDAIQRNIRGNHVALVGKGRAGADVALHLDADDGVLIDETQQNHDPRQMSLGFSGGIKKMVTVKIDGVDFEMTEQAAQALAKVQARADQASEKLSTVDETATKEKARADKAEEDLKAEQEGRKTDSSDEKIQELVTARVALEQSAIKILGEKNDKGEEIKVDAMTEAEIKKAVVLKVSPSAAEKLDSGDEAYLSARFDAAVESFGGHEEDDKGKQKRKDALHRIKGSGATQPEDRYDSAGAHERMLQRNRDLGTNPINRTPVPGDN